MSYCEIKLCFTVSNLNSFKAENGEKFAKEILYWTLLTDQWPFRVSYMMEIIDDADQREASGKDAEGIDDDVSLLQIYERYAKILR